MTRKAPLLNPNRSAFHLLLPTLLSSCPIHFVVSYLVFGFSDFMKEYQLDCPYAMDRLVKYGVPATVLHRQVDERDQIGRARQAAETVS